MGFASVVFGYLFVSGLAGACSAYNRDGSGGDPERMARLTGQGGGTPEPAFAVRWLYVRNRQSR